MDFTIKLQIIGFRVSSLLVIGKIKANKVIPNYKWYYSIEII